MKRKKVQNMRNNRLFTIATILLLFIFSVSVFMVGKELIQSKKEQDAFKDLTTIVEQSNNKNDNDNTNTEELKPNYEELYHMNNDFIGWLSIPNTKVDYPVMYTPNEPEYYLRRGFDKTYFQSGTPFIGENCTIDSDCLIIYGHNMKNGTMFTTLENYKDKEFYEENKVFSFNTLDEYRNYEVFAAFPTKILNAGEEGIKYYDYSGDLSETDFEKISNWLITNSLYDTGIKPTYDEQILILSTCSYHTENGRFVVAARRIK